MAAEATGGGEGPFEVEAGAGAEVAEVGPGERFGGEVGGEGAGQEIDGGEADAGTAARPAPAQIERGLKHRATFSARR